MFYDLSLIFEGFPSFAKGGGGVRMYVLIPSPFRVGTVHMEVPGTPNGAPFFEFELKPTGKDSADPTQHEFQHHITNKPNFGLGLVLVKYLTFNISGYYIYLISG